MTNPTYSLDVIKPETPDGWKHFIWLEDGEPDTGGLAGWASVWAQKYYGADFRLSETVLTWDDSSDPITWTVKVMEVRKAGGRVTYAVTVPGLPDEVWVTVEEQPEDGHQ